MSWDERYVLSDELCSSETRSASSVKLLPFFRRRLSFFDPSISPPFFCLFFHSCRLSLTSPSSRIFSTSFRRDRGTERLPSMSPTISAQQHTVHMYTVQTLCLKKGRPIHTNYIKSSFQSVNLQIQLGNITPVICVPSEPISSAVTTTTTFPQRLSADKLSVVVTRQWCYGPRRLWANNDNEEQKTTNSTNACQLCLKFYTCKLWKKPTRNGYNFREIHDNARFTSIHNTPLKT